MVPEITDIDGIGPTKAERLLEEGYETVEEIANAEADELAEVDGVGADRAFEFVLGAQYLLSEPEDDEFDLTPSELGEEREEDEQGAGYVEGDSSGDDDPSVEEDDEPAEEPAEEPSDDEDEAPESYTVSFEFEDQMQYDVFHAALMRHNERVTHQPVTNLMERCLQELYHSGKVGVEYTLTESELNALHVAVKQTRTRYQGANDIAQMDALKEVEMQVDEARSEYLF